MTDNLTLIAAIALNEWPLSQPAGGANYRLWLRYGDLQLPDRLRLIRAISEQSLIDLAQIEQSGDWLSDGNGLIMGGG